MKKKWFKNNNNESRKKDEGEIQCKVENVKLKLYIIKKN